MAQEERLPGQTSESPETNSASHPSEFAADISRLVIGTACNVLGGVAHASAEAFHVVDSHVSGPKPNVIEGILKGNARFLEEMSHTMEAVAERFRRQDVASSSTNAVSHHPSV